mgnify:CR=1 FL=1
MFDRSREIEMQQKPLFILLEYVLSNYMNLIFRNSSYGLPEILDDKEEKEREGDAKVYYSPSA